MSERRRLVAMHDVQPRSSQRCMWIRDWLGARGVGRVTLLVIPAPGRHSFARRAPALHDWLHFRVDEGDIIAQHGLLHERGVRRARGPREVLAWLQGGQAAEFAGLDPAATRERVHAGRAMLIDAGFDARGFVAPGYAYTRALRAQLTHEFDWYADLLSVFSVTGAHAAPAWCLGTRGIIRRPLSPLAARVMSSFARSTVRIDIHPEDFDYRAHRRALEGVLARTEALPSGVYDDLARG